MPPRFLQIEEFLDRKPKALSGGQRQRVALGRAIVRNAKVFLMDEPLSNLDAKLRVQMRSEIIKLHEALNATTIYVTHDQTEAMTMASRIVVMKLGYIQQIGSPIEIYNHPANIFVAGFIGSPSMNLIKATYEKGVITLSDGKKIPGSADVQKAHDDFYKAEVEASLQSQDQAAKLDKPIRTLSPKPSSKSFKLDRASSKRCALKAASGRLWHPSGRYSRRQRGGFLRSQGRRRRTSWPRILCPQRFRRHRPRRQDSAHPRNQDRRYHQPSASKRAKRTSSIRKPRSAFSNQP
jgi:ABC-type Fe3+/spermidine/putrescine transport system ATPase subunit